MSQHRIRIMNNQDNTEGSSPWITDRPPTKADADEDGNVAVPSPDCDEHWDWCPWTGMPSIWMPMDSAGEYTADNPPPLPLGWTEDWEPAATTIEGWLRTIPDAAIRERALANMASGLGGEPCNRLKDALIWSFSWENSREGQRFWSHCHSAAGGRRSWPKLPRKKIALGPEDIPPGSAIRPMCDHENWQLILECGESAIKTIRQAIDFADLKHKFRIKRPGESEWSRCEKEVAR